MNPETTPDPESTKRDDHRPMRPLHRSTPDELVSLQMENDLLTHENRHLRARLRAWNKVFAETDPAPAPEELARNAEAYEDLRWVLQRLSARPFGPLLRRRRGFRDLIQRYLGDGPG